MQPFQRHFCVFFLTAACITTFVSIHEKLNGRNKQFLRTANDSEDFFELFINASDFLEGNASTLFEKRPRDYIVLKNLEKRHYFVNASYDIFFLGLFELSTKYGVRHEGYSEISAALLAVDHVNSLQILPGYRVRLLINDTKCDPGVGVDRFFHALYSNKTITMLLGSGCSNVTESLANIVPYWNILQVSFGSISPSLSDRTKFPLFFRTVAPDSSFNPARVSFIKYFKWGTFATLSQSENSFLLPLNELVTELEKANITCSGTITFSVDNYKEQLQVLKDLDTRIIIGSFSHTISQKIFCEVFELKMYGADYVWLLQEQQLQWWNYSKDCDPQKLKNVTEGIIFVSNHNTIVENETSISGMTNEMFEEELNVSDGKISKYARQTYDAVWAMALALKEVRELNCGISLRDFSYKRKDLVNKFVYKMSLLKFMGVSGPVKFNGADRIGNSVFKQIQGNEIHDIAIYYSKYDNLDFNCKTCKQIKWKGNQVPIARRVLKLRLITIPKTAFYTVMLCSVAGILACIMFLYFNLHFRRVRTVKLSSPRLNNIAVLGCSVVYGAVILLGLDKASVYTEDNFSWLCMTRVYLLCAGFSLAFGSMFARTYRVHRIFIYSGTSLLRDKLLKDKQLIASIFVLLLIDGIIITFWVALDPMHFQLHNLTIEISTEDRGVFYQPQVEVCQSHNTTGWFIAIYGYKGFLLIMAVYMAWETRHIKVQVLNDSQYIGICVYSAVSSTIVVLLSTLLSDYTTISYLATAASILMTTTITLLLLFLPKLRAVLGRVEVDDPIMQSMGLKIECNTRRLMVDDPRELTYRMEVQNKVYRCELEALDREITRLEDILARMSPKHLQNVNVHTHTKHSAQQPIFIVSNQASMTSRASWPSTLRCSTKSISAFFSENKLQKHSSEHYFEKLKIFDRLKKFFGSIPSVWLNSPHCSTSQTTGVLLESPSIEFYRDKPNSNPEFSSKSLVDINEELVKANSTLDVLPNNGLYSFKNNPFILSLQHSKQF